jgi:filamentous hemagglutinin family protein
MTVVRCGWMLGIAMGGSLWANSAVAQITPDGTLGAESSVVTDNVELRGVNSTRIDGGATRGENLFHSFEQFNIGENRGAYFSNPTGIENIITRVTGGSASNINGTLGVLGSANLFFINPNGIIFGPSARLDVGGSFVGSTASAVQFGELGFFSASNPNSPSVLTINPSALFFNQRAIAEIVNSSVAPAGINPAGREVTGLRVPDGQSLVLVGGDVNINGGSLSAYEGRVELSGLAAPGVVGLNTTQNTFTLSVPQDIQRANISLSSGAEVNVRGGNGGSIAINAQNVNLAEQSVLRGGIATGLGTNSSSAGNIEINATGDIIFSDESFIANAVQQNAVGNAGNVIIEALGSVSFDSGDILSIVDSSGVGNSGDIQIIADSMSFTNGAQLVAATLGQGNAGNVIINARGRVSFDGTSSNGAFSSAAFTRVEEGGVGKGGDIRISADSLSLTNGAQLAADTRGQGDAGNVIIDAGGRVSFDGISGDGRFKSIVLTRVEESGVGKGGDIRISTDSLSLTNGAELLANTFGQGDAGNVIIDARGGVSFDNGNAFSRVEEGGVGKGGNIRISADSLSLTNSAQLVANTSGRGDAGNIEINASESVSVSGTSSIAGFSSALFTSTNPNSTGIGGDIIVNTPNLRVSDAGVLDARTNNNRNGGNITLNVRQAYILNGGQVLSTSSSAGNAGKITINATDRVIVSGNDSAFNDRVTQFGTAVAPIDDSSGLFVRAQNTGSAGDIEITAPQILLNNTAILSAESESGNGGNINLFPNDLLLLRRGSQITTTAGNEQFGGDGGNINITTPNGFVVGIPNENSDITANAFTGAGGEVNINAQGIFGIASRNRPTSLSDITASSDFGAEGIVELNTPDVDPSRGLIELPLSVIDASRQIASGCTPRTWRTGRFVVTGRGGLPSNPREAFHSNTVITRWVTLDKDTETQVNKEALPTGLSERSTDNQERFVEASTSNRFNQSSATKPVTTIPETIVPATGWVFKDNGEVQLISHAVHEQVVSPTCSQQ